VESLAYPPDRLGSIPKRLVRQMLNKEANAMTRNNEELRDSLLETET
jgi:hypothetical protein